MPRAAKMNWDGIHTQWRKMHEGKVYRVTCADLGLQRENWNKTDSYKAANEWWERKRGTLTPLTEIDRQISWATVHAPEELPELQTAKKAGHWADLDMIKFSVSLLEDYGIEIPADFDPQLARDLFGDGKIWADRLSREANTPSNQTIKGVADEFLARIRGKRKASTYVEMSATVNRLVEWFGPFPVAKIDEAFLGRIHAKLFEQSLANVTKKKMWIIFRRFVNYCFTEGKLDRLPRNLASTDFVFEVQPKAIKTHTVEQVRDCLAILNERFRLYAYLGLNCGMTNVDIGNLRHDQIQGGYLTRKRVKTERHDNVPTVKYLLWEETAKLLKKFKSKHPTLAITSKTGKALVESRIEGDKAKIKDLIRLMWKRHAKSPIMLKEFRSISATVLESHGEFGRYVSYFLGHSPQSLKDKHYAAPSPELFDKAMEWLGDRIRGG